MMGRAKIVSFSAYCGAIEAWLKASPVVEMGSWQSTTANPKALRMRELLHVTFEYDIPATVDYLRAEIGPFMPWADDHFKNERVSGSPINPGETYKQWRYPASAAQHAPGFSFSHSYAERYWPQYAGMFEGGKLPSDFFKHRPHFGIRHSYGGLDTLVALLANDHTTRQAYLPIFFPEDLTAARKGERIPCSLGYHFICRNDRLDILYPMRSCDYVRHFRDDVYLTCRLLLWVLTRLHDKAGAESAQSKWLDVQPGKLIMDITSLHCFEDDVL